MLHSPEKVDLSFYASTKPKEFETISKFCVRHRFHVTAIVCSSSRRKEDGRKKGTTRCDATRHGAARLGSAREPVRPQIDTQMIRLLTDGSPGQINYPPVRSKRTRLSYYSAP